MLATMRPDGDDARQARDDAETLPIVLPLPVERHPYAPPPEHKIFGFLGTCLVFAVAFAGLLLTFEHHFNPPPPSAPLVVSLLPLASPPETPPKPKEAPAGREAPAPAHAAKGRAGRASDHPGPDDRAAPTRASGEARRSDAPATGNRRA